MRALSLLGAVLLLGGLGCSDSTSNALGGAGGSSGNPGGDAGAWTAGTAGGKAGPAPTGEALSFGTVLHPVAGGGLGDGGPATAGDLSAPGGLAKDAEGNLYIADAGHHVIRKVDAAGKLSTFAGTGIAQFAGDGAAATAASFNRPFGLALDPSGNLFVADSGNLRIRRIDRATGIITTVAGNGTLGYSGDGGDATAASFSFPAHPDAGGIAVFGGALYVVDNGNHRLRKIDLATQVISTVAGTGTPGFSGDGGPASEAQLKSPREIEVDASGNFFISDTSNNRIRKIDPQGVITTVAGNGNAGAYAGEGGDAKSATLGAPYHAAVAANGDLCIVLYGGNRVVRVDPRTNLVSTVAGTGAPGFAGDDGPGTAAMLYRPSHALVDSAGTVYVSDNSNNRVRKLDPSGVISTVAGTYRGFAGEGVIGNAAEFSNPTGMASDADGDLYIADAGNHRIRKLARSTGLVTTCAGTGLGGFEGDGGRAELALLNGPTAVVLDDSGNLFIADTQNHRVRRVDAATGIISTYAGSDTSGFAGDGGPADSAALLIPSDLALDQAGNLYIADAGNHRIRRVDSATGVISTVAGSGSTGAPGAGDGGPATEAALQNPTGVALGDWGALFIADSGHHAIRAVELESGRIVTAAGSGMPGYSGDGAAAANAALNRPRGLAVDAAGQIFFADTDNHAVRKIDYYGDGSIATVAGNGTEGFAGDEGTATEANLCSPTDVLLGKSEVYIVDRGNHRIRRF